MDHAIDTGDVGLSHADTLHGVVAGTLELEYLLVEHEDALAERSRSREVAAGDMVLDKLFQQLLRHLKEQEQIQFLSGSRFQKFVAKLLQCKHRFLRHMLRRADQRIQSLLQNPSAAVSQVTNLLIILPEFQGIRARTRHPVHPDSRKHADLGDPVHIFF